MKKSFLLFIFLAFLFNGCGIFEGDSIEKIEKICKEEGKKFILEKRFNFRFGKYEETASCK